MYVRYVSRHGQNLQELKRRALPLVLGASSINHIKVRLLIQKSVHLTLYIVVPGDTKGTFVVVVDDVIVAVVTKE